MCFLVSLQDHNYYSLPVITMTKKSEKRSSDEDIEIVPLDDHTNYVYTFDLGLSAALISVGFSLISLDRENLRKVQFVFRKSDGIDNVMEQYWAGQLEGKLRAHFDTLRMLKNRLYSD